MDRHCSVYIYRYMIYLGPLAFLLHVFEQRQMMPWCLLFGGCRSGLNLRRDLSWSSSARDALPCHPTVVVWADSTLNFRWNCPANARDAGVGLDTAGTCDLLKHCRISNTLGKPCVAGQHPEIQSPGMGHCQRVGSHRLGWGTLSGILDRSWILWNCYLSNLSIYLI